MEGIEQIFGVSKWFYTCFKLTTYGTTHSQFHKNQSLVRQSLAVCLRNYVCPIWMEWDTTRYHVFKIFQTNPLFFVVTWCGSTKGLRFVVDIMWQCWVSSFSRLAAVDDRPWKYWKWIVGFLGIAELVLYSMSSRKPLFLGKTARSIYEMLLKGWIFDFFSFLGFYDGKLWECEWKIKEIPCEILENTICTLWEWLT